MTREEHDGVLAELEQTKRELDLALDRLATVEKQAKSKKKGDEAEPVSYPAALIAIARELAFDTPQLAIQGHNTRRSTGDEPVWHFVEALSLGGYSGYDNNIPARVKSAVDRALGKFVEDDYRSLPKFHELNQIVVGIAFVPHEG